MATSAVARHEHAFGLCSQGHYAAECDESEYTLILPRSPGETMNKYDTGEVLEPKLWPTNNPDTIGSVDFDDDEGASHVTVRVVRDSGTDGYIIQVTNLGNAPIRVQEATS